MIYGRLLSLFPALTSVKSCQFFGPTGLWLDMLSQRLCHSEGLLWLVKVAQPGWFPLSAVELRELLFVLAREA